MSAIAPSPGDLVTPSLAAIALAGALGLSACHGARQVPGPEGEGGWKTLDLPESAQDWSGDADPYYARYFSASSGLPGWYNESWFAHSYPASRLEALDGYVAPPLDGIWATAPYLHNGSVPTLDALLNSSARPARWKRLPEYDPESVGWKYDAKAKKDAYDTRLPSYGKQGHYFGDKLSAEERRAVVEFLKTL